MLPARPDFQKVEIFFQSPSRLQTIRNAPLRVTKKLPRQFGNPKRGETIVKAPDLMEIDTPISLDPSLPRDKEILEYCVAYKKRLMEIDQEEGSRMVISDPIGDAVVEADKQTLLMDIKFKIHQLYKAKNYEKLANALRHLKTNIRSLSNEQIYNKLLVIVDNDHKAVDEALSDSFNQSIFLAEMAMEAGYFARSGEIIIDKENGDAFIGRTIEELAFWLDQNPERTHYIETRLGKKSKSQPKIKDIQDVQFQDIEVPVAKELTQEERIGEAIKAGIEIGEIKSLEKGWFEVNGQKSRKEGLVKFYQENPLALQGLEDLVAQYKEEAGK